MEHYSTSICALLCCPGVWDLFLKFSTTNSHPLPLNHVFLFRTVLLQGFVRFCKQMEQKAEPTVRHHHHHVCPLSTVEIYYCLCVWGCSFPLECRMNTVYLPLTQWEGTFLPTAVETEVHSTFRPAGGYGGGSLELPFPAFPFCCLLLLWNWRPKQGKTSHHILYLSYFYL